MSYVDSRTEFSFWSLFAAPCKLLDIFYGDDDIVTQVVPFFLKVIVATDIRNMSEQKKSILLNEEVIKGTLLLCLISSLFRIPQH
jgi:hypothetical protein